MPILSFESPRCRGAAWWPSSSPAAKARDFALFEELRARGEVAYRSRGRSE